MIGRRSEVPRSHFPEQGTSDRLRITRVLRMLNIQPSPQSLLSFQNGGVAVPWAERFFWDHF